MQEIILDSQGIKTFTQCPLRFKFKHISGIEEKDNLTPARRRDRALADSIKQFYKTIVREQETPTEKELRKFFVDLYFGADGPDVMSETSTNERNVIRKAYEKLNKFYRKRAEVAANPVGAELEATIQVGDKTDGTMKLTADMDVVSSESEDEARLVLINIDNYSPTEHRLRNDMSVIAAIRAFYDTFSDKKCHVYCYHVNYANLKPITFNTDHDFKRLYHVMHSIKDVLSQDIVWPQNSYLCKSCGYKELCMAWPKGS